MAKAEFVPPVPKARQVLLTLSEGEATVLAGLLGSMTRDDEKKLLRERPAAIAAEGDSDSTTASDRIWNALDDLDLPR